MHLVVLFALAVPAPASDFEHCARRFADDRDGRAAAACVRAAADAGGRWADAAAWLESALSRHPDSGWLAMQLAVAKQRVAAPDVIDRFAAAVDKFAAVSEHAGEAQARVGLGVALYDAGRPADAWREVPRALDAAKRSGDAQLMARAFVYEAWLAQQTGERLGRALRALYEAEALVFPDGPYALRLRVLVGLGNVSLDLGRYDAALSYYRRMTGLARENADPPMVALGGANILTARRKQMEARPDRTQLPEFTNEARRLVALADETSDRTVQAIAHRTLGDLLASAPATRDEAAPQYELAVKYARQSGDRNETANCLWALGRFLADGRPTQSRALIDEALRMAVESGSASSVAYAWRQQMRLGWKSLPRDRAVAESFRALDAIETLRAVQGADLTRAAVLGAWTDDYYWLIGRLLGGDTLNAQEDVARAFDVSERMRARLLLDSLQRPRVAHGAAPSAERRRELLQAISTTQRRLLDPAVQGRDRQAALAHLEQLEREEAEVRAGSGPGHVPLVNPRDLVSLDTVMQSLGPNEAMLSFSIGVGRNFYGEFDGGAWLLLTTIDGTTVFTLPDRTRLEPIVGIFRGLVERGGEIDAAPAVALYQTLLEPALGSLPSSVTRLVVIADGALHHLPFAALRPSPGALPVGMTHEVVVVPSATIWKQSTERAPLLVRGDALVLADPVMAAVDQRQAVARDRDWSLTAVDLGRLEYSRQEGRSVVAHMRGGSRLLAGHDASEAAVKALPNAFGILHFATHALVDEAHPDRSAVLLSAGSNDDDGLLQAREIAELPLDGRIVVLSACRSATGAVLRGEGVVGLSRAFFEARARTVVGTLWAIRDDHAAYVADAFYAALKQGQSVGSAMREARRRAMDAGLPAAAWASYVVIGDDRVAAVPRPRPWRGAGPAGAIAAAVILSLLLIAALRFTRAAYHRSDATR